jgi:hypothetical protein
MTRRAIGCPVIISLSMVLFMGSPAERGIRSRTELFAHASPVTSALSTRHRDIAITEVEQRGLHDSLQRALEAARYRVYQDQQHAVAWYAENPAQQIRARFTPDSVQLQANPGRAHARRVGMKLHTIGYGERQIGVGVARLATTDNRIEYTRSLLGDDTAEQEITEWYVNTPAGLEQGFTLESPPGERRDGERLRVALALEGELRAYMVDGGRALEFKDAAAQPVMRYDHLTVRDALGRELQARMAVRLERDEIWLEVDDRGGVWPVTIDPTFTQQQKLEGSDTEQDRFGVAVAISGETVVVGAPFVGPGAAYVFVRSGGVWNQQQKLEPSDAAAGDLFGFSVAISGETIVIGAGHFTGIGDDNPGFAYVFVRNNGVWSQQQKLAASDGTGGERFGRSVAVSGETVVVGAPGDDNGLGGFQGSAYIFVRSSGGWNEQQKLLASDATSGDQFGSSVTISGETVVIGAPEDDGGAGFRQGSAYVFVRSSGVWSQQQKLLASDAAGGQVFGGSVTISGETVVIGRRTSAYVFVRSGEVWSQQQQLLPPDPVANNNFGASVAISGETVVVGADFDDGPTAQDQGSAYVFVRSSGVWSQQQKLVASDGAASDLFGFSAGISGQTVVVGALLDDVGASVDHGSAYVFAVGKSPTITLKAPMSLWPPNHSYQNVTVNQMVQSASDPEGGDLINVVRIEKVSSDEPDNVPGGSDGNTSNDIVIGGTCTSVNLRSERDETKNGRVYSVTLRVADSAGNITRAVFKVSVPHDQAGLPAIEDGPTLMVTSNCP